jgi:hypothetical protein
MGIDPDSRGHRIFALAICALGYLYVFPYQSRLNNPNENVRLYMTAAIVEEGRYEIDGMRERWGWVNDAAKYGGHLYSVKAPGTSLLGVPAYAAYLGACELIGAEPDRTVALWLCRLTATILPTLLWLYFFHAWLTRQAFAAPTRDAAFFSVALGSLLYGYGMLFVSHTLSAVAAFWAFMLLHDLRTERGAAPRHAAFAAGLLAAATTFFEYPGLIASVVLTAYAAYVLWPRGGPRALAAYAAGGAIPTLLVMHFQWRAFGSPFTPGHLFVESAAFREAHHQGFYGAVGPSGAALQGLLIDLGAGLFPLTPLLIFALPGLLDLLRTPARRAEALCALALVVLTVLGIASMNNWRGGWTIGPRYLAVTVPFLAWMALHGFEWLAERSEGQAIAAAVGTTGVGLIASGIPSAYYPHLPPEITRPLPELMSVLIAHDFAPRNAGNLVGAYGTASMAPMLFVATTALAFCLRSIEAPRRRLALGGAALFVMLALAAPLLKRPEGNDASGAVAFITRRWTPAGHDEASMLAAQLRQQERMREADLRELARLYAQEGRKREARRALAGKP